MKNELISDNIALMFES